MKLTDEQRAGIARFLGDEWPEAKRLAGKLYAAPYGKTLTDTHSIGAYSDADLMLALLERAAELGHSVYLAWDHHAPHAWLCTVGHGADPDTDGAVIHRMEGAAEAVIRGVLALEGVMP
jgi:hypothetical protein